MIDYLAGFAPDYMTAKSKFLTAAERVGAQISSYSVGNPTNDGQPLTIDVAILPGTDPQRAVVVSSGLHGVEGFFGSAVQVAWLRALASGRSSNFNGSVVLVHALNPYGFHDCRRCDGENVDLNRNFLGPTERYAGMPDGYAELAPLLNPASSPTRFDAFPVRALAAVCRHGLNKLKATTAVGQYEFPEGLFFGGRQPAASTKIVQSHVTNWIGDAVDVVHIDLHTGLGGHGRVTLLLVESADAPGLAWYETHFGDDPIEPLAPSGGIAYAARGVMGSWLEGHFTDRNYRFLVAEFGTYGVFRVFAALRAENRAFRSCPPEDPRRVRARAELVRCFCPASERWRHRVVGKGLDIIRNAQASLAD